ncbi:MAG: PEGA domain-containing protein [Myxococcales bacterium]|nr:PEGA domain-containing protein [Myxococcales bacterium]
MLLSMLTTLALAGDEPDVLVVGVHLPGLVAEAALAAAAQLEATLDERAPVDAFSPRQVGKRIRGREAIILETFALGPGRERLKEARLLYDRAQVEEAQAIAEDAVSLLQKGMAVSTTTRDLLDAQVLLGMIRIALGDEKGATSAFRKAAALDLDRELDAVNHPPRVIELYDAARGDLSRREVATVSVLTSVGATVFVDGEDLGTAPLTDIRLVPGEHFFLVRAAGGASSFQALTVTPGEERILDIALQSQGLGVAASDNPGRSRQVKDLYRALGEYGDGVAVLMAGQIPGGLVGVQLYAPRSGNFSRVLTTDPGDDPMGAITDLLPTVATYLAANGDIRADRVGAQVLALDIGDNRVLAGLLFDPQPIDEAVAAPITTKKGVPWWVWAGTGAVVAGAGATVAAVLLQPTDDPGPAEDPDQGTIVLGPMP